MAVTTFELKVRKSGGISNGSQQAATKRREEERETGRGRGREEKWKGGREEQRGRETVLEFSVSWDKDGSSENVSMHRQRLRQINLIFELVCGE